MFIVLYRTGGTVLFKWKATVAFETRREAIAALLSLESLGFSPTFILPHKLFLDLPLSPNADEYSDVPKLRSGDLWQYPDDLPVEVV